MFGAVALFVVLLLVMLYLAFVRFRNPPQPRATPTPVGVHAPTVAPALAWSVMAPHELPAGFHPRRGEEAHG